MVRRAISPNFYADTDIGQQIYRDVVYRENSDLNIETKIDIYADRVFGWFLNIATDLEENNEAGFVILMICMSQIEGIEQFKRGEKTKRGESMELIKDCLKRIFTISSLNEERLKKMIDELRNGLFHDGMTRKNLFISGDYPLAISFLEGDSIIINPHLFLNKIRGEFEQYINLLKDPVQVDLRKNFETMFDLLNM
jgi:hypothetical protein